MGLWKDDKELFLLAKQELFSALVGDVLDKLVLKALQNGISTVDAFDKFGIM